MPAPCFPLAICHKCLSRALLPGRKSTLSSRGREGENARKLVLLEALTLSRRGTARWWVNAPAPFLPVWGREVSRRDVCCLPEFFGGVQQGALQGYLVWAHTHLCGCLSRAVSRPNSPTSADKRPARLVSSSASAGTRTRLELPEASGVSGRSQHPGS